LLENTISSQYKRKWKEFNEKVKKVFAGQFIRWQRINNMSNQCYTFPDGLWINNIIPTCIQVGMLQASEVSEMKSVLLIAKPNNKEKEHLPD
jgi:hypothetical protein